MSDHLDFDAWRADQAAARRPETVTIFGQAVSVPTSISLDLVMRVDEADIEDAETLTDLVSEMYGEGELQRWREAKCSTLEFAILLAWGSARAQGEDIDFADAAQLIAERRSGKAPNRAARRVGKRKRGRTSRR